jgi:hypothetical protein
VHGDSLGRWVARVFLWLVPSFALWYLASTPLAHLQAALARPAAGAWFPGLVSGWDAAGGIIEFATRLQARQGGRVGELIFSVNALLYSYGLALFAALSLATAPRRWGALLAGLAALTALSAWGVLFDLLQQTFIAEGALAAPDYLPTPVERNLIALGYQAGIILFPSVAPLVAWAVAHREFVASRMGE